MKKAVAVIVGAPLVLSTLSAFQMPPIPRASATSEFESKLESILSEVEPKYRPEVRWWLAEGLNTDKTLRDEVKWLADAGFGATEFLAMPEDGAPDEIYGWGSDEWNADSQLIMEEATSRGLGFSLTSGANFSHANLPDTYNWQGSAFTPDNKASSKSLNYSTIMLKPGEQFSGKLARPSHDVPEEVKDIVFQGAVAAKVTTPRAGAGVDGAEGSGTGEIDFTTLTDLTSDVVEAEGEYSLEWKAPEDGEYAIFTYWMHGTAQTGDPSVATNYTVNYVDSYGIEALKDYWEEFVLTEDVRHILEQSGRGEIYMDSLELDFPGAASTLWGYNFKEEFLERRGYDITPYLPLIGADGALFVVKPARTWDYTVAGEEHQDQLVKVRADLDRTMTEMYIENVLKPLQTWLHSLGMQLRAEPSYGMNFEISTPGKYLDDIETESFAHEGDVDLIRGMLGSANMYGVPLSSETGAVGGRNYYYDMDYWTNLSYLQFAGGVNRTVFHGHSAIEGSEEDTAWPGHEGMSTFFSDRFGDRQPASEMYPEWTEMLGRNQKILRQGQPQRDIAILRTDHSYNNYPNFSFSTPSLPENNSAMHNDPWYWQDMSLQHAGYTYDYFSEQLLADESNVEWTDGVLQPGGPAYQAVIVYQESMDFKSATRLLEMAEDGVPVLFVNNTVETLNSRAPDVTYAQAASKSSTLVQHTDAELQAVVAEIKALPNVRVLDNQSDTLATLRDMGVEPRVAYSEPNDKLLTVSRLDTKENILYTFAYSFKFDTNKGEEPHTFDLSLAAPGKPYVIDDWTGDVSAMGAYDVSDERTNVQLTLKPGEAEIIALDLDDPAAGVHAISTTADRVVEDNGVRSILATESGEYTTNLSNGRAVRTKVKVPEKIALENWDIRVEDWNEGDKVVNTESKFGHETREAYYTTKKTELRFSDSTLLPWKDLPATDEQLTQLSGKNPSMSQVSGVGTYETTFELPRNWNAKNGAVLRIGSTNGEQARVVVNGKTVEGLDLRTLEVDVSDYLVKNRPNTVQIIVATTLTNRMLARGYPTPGPVQDYGITGAVEIVPYTLARVPNQG
ncbi:glycosyl hydrolase [Arthrobacter sp. D2-10]